MEPNGCERYRCVPMCRVLVFYGGALTEQRLSNVPKINLFGMMIDISMSASGVDSFAFIFTFFLPDC